jgi:hypothetical protein
MKPQKPVPAIIAMELKDPQDSGESFLGFSTTLYQYGYIFEEPRELRRRSREPRFLELICTFVDDVATTKWWKDRRIQKHFGEGFHKLKHPPKVIASRDVIVDFDNIQTCSCKKRNNLLLEGARIIPLGGLTCGNCLNPLPNYSIPEDLGVESWSRLHAQIYDIWLASGTLEIWARNQLAKFNSEFNKASRKLTAKIHHHYKLPVFYSLFVEDGSSEKCPWCRKKGKPSSWLKPQRVCHDCKIAFYT